MSTRVNRNKSKDVLIEMRRDDELKRLVKSVKAMERRLTTLEAIVQDGSTKSRRKSSPVPQTASDSLNGASRSGPSPWLDKIVSEFI